MYKILYDNPKEDLFTRLLKIRSIESDLDEFLNPTFNTHWIDPYKLKGLTKSLDRIQKAIKNNEKIMVFGDYDADGITASFVIYKFVRYFLKYENISIRLPDRQKDGYGIRPKHIKKLNEIDIDLIITVDNGITAIEESKLAKKYGIDMIITDHHEPGKQIPDAYSIINQHTSPDYNFKGLAGVGIAFKIIMALSDIHIDSRKDKKEILNYFLPIVAIGTVADCVPLVGENRLLVSKGLELLNDQNQLPEFIKAMLDYLNLDSIGTFHIGYIIGPRLNACGRIDSPYHSLNSLIHNGSKQKESLNIMDNLNKKRKKIQDKAYKNASKDMDMDQNILFASSPDFHKGIVGIIAGRYTQKYNKPSAILSINKNKGVAVGSLRGPEYFHIVKMLKQADKYLERYGGHQQAGGMTVKLENLDKVRQIFYKYCQDNINKSDLQAPIKVDTKLHTKELDEDYIKDIFKLGPFGEGNPQPKFVIQNTTINKLTTVGKKNKHLKMYLSKDGIDLSAMFWNKGDQKNKIPRNTPLDIIGTIKKDDYNGGYYINGIDFFKSKNI